MPKFTLPPISPLIGTTVPNYYSMLKGKKISPRHYVKVALTFLMMLIGSLSQWVDHLYFNKKDIEISI